MKFVAVIPARQGSKGIPDKNIQVVNGAPLLAHSVRFGVDGQRGGLVDGVYISTDSRLQENLAIDAGCDSLGLRGAPAATDDARDADWITDFLSKWRATFADVPDWIVQLRPTQPFRNLDFLRDCVNMCRGNPEISVLRSVVPMEKSPCKMYFLGGGDEENRLIPCVGEEISGVVEHWESPRQRLPVAQLHDGCIDVINVHAFMKQGGINVGEGRAIVNTQASPGRDIDDPRDMWVTALGKAVEELDLWRGGRRVFVDIDGTLTEPLELGGEYQNARVNPRRVEVVNALVRAGNDVVLYTARGTETGRDWREVTEAQMREWGVDPGVRVEFGKPAWDVLIDDRVFHCALLDVLPSMGGGGGLP